MRDEYFVQRLKKWIFVQYTKLELIFSLGHTGRLDAISVFVPLLECDPRSRESSSTTDAFYYTLDVGFIWSGLFR